MPTPTYKLINTITLAANTAEVVLSSLPQTYRDLVLIVQVDGLGGNPASRNASVFLNGVRGTQVWMYGAAGVATAGFEGADVTLPIGNSVNTATVNFMDYSATDKNKTTLVRAGDPNNVTWAMVGRTPLGAAVNTITLLAPDSGADVWLAGSTFALYGIAS